ncbi:VOC family protein [Micromonospora sp. M12]
MAADERSPIGIPGARAVHHVAYTVPDLGQAVQFFVDVIGAELVYQLDRVADPDGDWMTRKLASIRRRWPGSRCCVSGRSPIWSCSSTTPPSSGRRCRATATGVDITWRSTSTTWIGRWSTSSNIPVYGSSAGRRPSRTARSPVTAGSTSPRRGDAPGADQPAGRGAVREADRRPPVSAGPAVDQSMSRTARVVAPWPATSCC